MRGSRPLAVVALCCTLATAGCVSSSAAPLLGQAGSQAITLSAPRAIYRRDEPIVLTVTISNVGSTTWTYDADPCAEHLETKLVATRLAGVALSEHLGFAGCPYSGPPRAEPIIALAPSASYSRQFDLSKEYSSLPLGTVNVQAFRISGYDTSGHLVYVKSNAVQMIILP
jgi:hypothetical protein